MLEFLPKKQKKSLKEEYFLRLLAVSLLLLFAIGILSLVSLSPSYFLLLEKEKIVAKQFSEMEKFSKTAVSDTEFQSDIKNFKEMTSLLRPSVGIISISDLVYKIISKKNLGIKIYSITAIYYKKEQYQLLIKGNATSRDIMKLFIEKLKESGLFENVDLPISNFTKIADIDFNISLTTAI